MAIADVVKMLGKDKGWTVEVDNHGDGTCEALAMAGDDTDSYVGKLQGLAKWAKDLPDMTVEPEPVMDLSTWEEEYGGLTDADIQEALNGDTATAEPTEEADTENTLKEEGDKDMAKVSLGSLFTKKEEKTDAPTTTVALPSVTTMSAIPTEEVRADAEEALKEGALLAIDYRNFKGKVSTGRSIRVASTSEEKVFAWDVSAFNKAATELQRQFPKMAPAALAAAAAQEAERTFRLTNILSYTKTGEVAAPINAPGSGVIVLRPTTEAGVSQTGRGFPFPINKLTATRLLETGNYTEVPEGV